MLVKQRIINFLLVVIFPSMFFCPVVNANDNKRADDIIALFKMGKPGSQQQTDSLLKELKSLIATDDLPRRKEYIRAKCWNQQSDTSEQLAQAITFANKQLDIFDHSSPSEITIDLTICKTSYQRLSGQIDTVLQDLTQVINQAYTIEAPLLIAHGRNQRGSLHSYQGNYAASLEDLLTAQDYFESLKLTYWSNLNLGALATTYRRFGDAKMALEYQLQLEKIYQEQGKKLEANAINIQIASSLDELHQLHEANARYRVSQQFLAKEQPVIAADMSINIANNLIELGNYSEALNILQQAEGTITTDFNAPYSFLQLYLAKAQFKLNNYTDALHALKNAENAFLIDKNQRGMSKVHALRSKVYAAKESWQKAYETLNAHLTVHLNQDKDVLAKHNAELQTRFNTDKIKNENNRLVQYAKDKEIQLSMLQRNEAMQIIILVLVGIILILVSIFAYKQMHSKFRFKKLALTDELTQIANRRETYLQAEKFLASSKKNKTPFALISFDADHFKSVNDKLGHDIGDKVLIRLADIASKMIRNNDLVGRVGGEEFIVLLPNTDIELALTIANRLLSAIEQYKWSSISNDLAQTVSAGVVSYQSEMDISELLLKADKALYEAKAAGRNQAIAF